MSPWSARGAEHGAARRRGAPTCGTPLYRTPQANSRLRPAGSVLPASDPTRPGGQSIRRRGIARRSGGDSGPIRATSARWSSHGAHFDWLRGGGRLLQRLLDHETALGPPAPTLVREPPGVVRAGKVPVRGFDVGEPPLLVVRALLCVRARRALGHGAVVDSVHDRRPARILHGAATGAENPSASTAAPMIGTNSRLRCLTCERLMVASSSIACFPRPMVGGALPRG